MDNDHRGLDKELPQPVEFGLTLKRALHLFTMRTDEALRPIDLNLGLWSVLRELSRMPGASASELARASFHAPQTLGSLLHRLESLGLVVRTTGRGRIIENHLTEAGREVVKQANATVECIISEALSVFTKADRETFERLATSLVAALSRP
ncbi:MarR family transcriptional regulator [Streptomyces adustus]|uniref:MarR family transcriptional regulator n=1 Tax=Streptomyces adustus TaxID=1609272 RepID=A0A5N8VE41_9ACTN|nr:MarR family transcriptional regulator [Streptomyces adustus]MPY33481.1 MarR family transcriptional regulator [Streptomyces adustus]